MFDYIQNQLTIRKIRRPRKEKIIMERMKRLKDKDKQICHIIVYKNDGSNYVTLYFDMV